MPRIGGRLRASAFSILLILCASSSQANQQVLPGYDLFETEAGTYYDFEGYVGMGVMQFEGVPLGSFDFGSGPQPTGDADTIVRRLDTATVASATIDIEIVALSLVSTDPIDIGNGPEHILIDLNFDAGGSQMTINGLASEGDPHGTFDSSLNFFFDVMGTTTGYIGTIPTTITQTGTGWRHEANPGEPLLTGVNYLLNGLTDDNDFWPTEPVLEEHPGDGVHVASAGEPVLPSISQLGMGLLSLGLIGTFIAARKRRQGALES